MPPSLTLLLPSTTSTSSSPRSLLHPEMAAVLSPSLPSLPSLNDVERRSFFFNTFFFISISLIRASSSGVMATLAFF
jgi:hypothetical protein